MSSKDRWVNRWVNCQRCQNPNPVPPDVGKGQLVGIIVGERPGVEEVKEMKPFVGPSGKLLFRKLDRNNWYITNVVKCPNGDVKQCQPLFKDELQEVLNIFPSDFTPVILLLGRTAVEAFDLKFSVELSGAFYRRNLFGKDVILVVSVHPAFVLRNRVFELFNRAVEVITHKLYEKFTDNPPWQKVSPEDLIKFVGKKKRLAVDVEVVKGSPYSIAVSDGKRALVSMLTKDVARAVMSVPELILHNATYDVRVLEDFTGQEFNYDHLFVDTTILYHWLWSDFRKGLDILTPLVGMGNYKSEFLDKVGGWNGVNSMASGLFGLGDDFLQYNAYDAISTYRLYERFYPKLSPDLKEFWEEIFRYMVAVVIELERNGVYVDIDELKKQKVKLTEEIAEIQDKMGRLGIDVNPSSPKAVVDYFRSKGININSSSQSVLEEILETTGDEVADLILQFRQAQKIKSTYVDGFLEKLGDDRRIRAKFNITGTASHRLSSSSPNLQNLPEGWYGKILIAPEGWKLVAVDYSQIELRVLAEMSRDPVLVKEFNEGVDLHDTTAREILLYKGDEVPKEVRRQAKAINFGMVYGLSAQGLAKALGCSETEAQRILNRFFQKYSRVKEWREEVYQFAKDNGYVETLLGRRRWVGLAEDKSLFNTAVNSTIQGSAMDIVVVDMVRVWKERGKSLPDKNEFKFVSQVHDAIYFEVKEDIEIENELARFIEDYWAGKLSVPIKVKVETYRKVPPKEVNNGKASQK